MLDLDRLDLGLFERGAIIRSEGRFRRLADPRHAPVRSLRALAGGLVGVRDGAAVLKLLRGERRRDHHRRRAPAGGCRTEHGRDLLRAVPARDLPRRAAHDVEPLSRLRPAHVLRRAGSAAGRRHGSDCDATRGGNERAQGHRRRDGRATCRLARVGRPASSRRRRRRDLGSRRRARARVERGHVRVLRRTRRPRFRGRGSSSTAKAARSTTSACRARRRRATPLPAARSCRRRSSVPANRIWSRSSASYAAGSARASPTGATCGPTGFRGRSPRTRWAASAPSPCASPRASTPAATTGEHPSLNGALASGRRAAEAVLADS